jgi:TonB family protein
MTNLDRPQSVRSGEPVKPTSNFGISHGGPSGHAPAPQSPPPVNNPLSRVLSFGGDRSAALLLALAVGASTLVHSGLALAAYIREVKVTPIDATCRAGESIEMQAFARTAWNAQLMVTNSAEWKVAERKTASHAGGGLMRCISQGDTLITVTYLNASKTFTLKVEPPIQMIEAPKEEPPPPPLPEPEPDPTPPPKVALPEQPKEAAAPPAAAKVGSLLTAPDDSKNDPDEGAVKFLSDENGQEYGSGVAALGGTADVGKEGAKKNGKEGGTGTGGGGGGGPGVQTKAAPTVDLSRAASLTVENPCKGFFPADADDDVAKVQVIVSVRADGTVEKAVVMDESPKGQGFGKAARTCMLSAKFNPAFGKDGKAIGATQTFNIRFTR